MWKAFRVKQSLENGITEEKNKSGFRKKMISVQLLIVLVAVMLFCSGCAGKMNAKKIFRQSSENMQKVTSSANHVELAIQMSDILNLMVWKAFRVKQSLKNKITEERNKSGYYKKLLSIQLLIASVIVMLFCSGCAGKMNAKKIFRQSSENMQKVTSSANHVELAIQMSDILNLMEVNMEMDLENTTEPPAGHAKGTARVTIKDSEVSADLELYQVEEDGKQVTYSGTNGSWKKESAEGSNENHLGIDGNIFAQEGKALESFHLSEQETTVNGKACYQLYGDVTGTELMGLLGKEMVEAYHLVNLPEEDAIRNLKIPVIFDIYKEELLPAKIVVDMSDVMGDLYKSYGETTKVNLYSIVLQFTDYNKVDEIHVPDEIKNSAK